VQIDRGEETFTYERRHGVEAILQDVCANVESLNAEFRQAWKYFLPQFKTFLNSSLQEGRDGGIYRAAVAGEAFNLDLIAERFHEWLTARSEEVRFNKKGKKTSRVRPIMVRKFEAFYDERRDAFFAYLKAYFDAIRIEYMLRKHMPEVSASKLGGGPTEGVMVGRVKLVDRLGFTMGNFAGGRIGKNKKSGVRAKQRKTKKAQPRMPQLYRKWYGATPVSAVFSLPKIQPPHIGHIAMIRSAVAVFGAERVFVLPSLNEPDLNAAHWKGLGVADTRKKLVAGDYTYVFSNKLREEMLRYGLPAGVHVEFAATNTFRRYLNRNLARRRDGKVGFLIGQKEVDEERFRKQFARYDDYLEPCVIPMQGGGVSATAVRQLGIRRLFETGYTDAYDFLWNALGYIPASERNRIIHRLLKEWEAVDRVVRRLV